MDIAADGFNENDYGKTFGQLMAEIHGRDPDGTWVTGVEVFRRLYLAAGYGKLVWLSRLPLIRGGLGLGYGLFAKYRIRLTGRCTAGCTAEQRSGDLSGEST